ncbi:acyltransferase family protein [uncultured Arcticibacterium sp.]|uniref:acyltransferase family protein n=1 Tax=uncultured Arcticibacterium sp. TaxID=2173042 RepID=UPI0030FB4F05
MRLKNIDSIKGLLIVLVIIGHILLGGENEEVWSVIIYSFHMPLFVGISGYLFKVSNVVDFNLLELLRKYLLRLILPWSIAVLAYYSFSIAQNTDRNIIHGLVSSFLFPFYHLWFIPSFLSWVILTWFLKKLKTSDRLLLFIAFFISLVSILLKWYPESYQDFGTLKSGITLIQNKYRPYFYFFFILGLAYRNIQLNKPTFSEYMLPFLGFIAVVTLYYFPNNPLSIFNFFLMNAVLLLVLMKLSSNKIIPRNKTLEWLGFNSLGIYLWHLFPILICKSVIGIENSLMFYLAAICSEVIFIIGYNYLLKFDFLRKYAFGL